MSSQQDNTSSFSRMINKTLTRMNKMNTEFRRLKDKVLEGLSYISDEYSEQFPNGEDVVLNNMFSSDSSDTSDTNSYSSDSSENNIVIDRDKVLQELRCVKHEFSEQFPNGEDIVLASLLRSDSSDTTDTDSCSLDSSEDNVVTERGRECRLSATKRRGSFVSADVDDLTRETTLGECSAPVGKKRKQSASISKNSSDENSNSGDDDVSPDT